MKFLFLLCCAFVGFASCSIRDVVFTKLGSFSGKNAAGVEYSKYYYLPRNLLGSWHTTRILCQSYGLELARLETLEEYTAVRGLLNAVKSQLTHFVHVDGTNPTGLNEPHKEWFFEDGSKVSYAIEWDAGEPTAGTEKCLTLCTPNNFKFNDIACIDYTQKFTFVCQRSTSF